MGNAIPYKLRENNTATSETLLARELSKVSTNMNKGVSREQCPKRQNNQFCIVIAIYIYMFWEV